MGLAQDEFTMLTAVSVTALIVLVIIVEAIKLNESSAE
jgi:hypothetical protein